MLVISLPASDTTGSPHTQSDDVEVGGIRGREALDRLRNVVGRVESSWRPATAEEGFEIVRRRLFEPLAGDQFKNRDVTARAFADLYRAQSAEFPPECKGGDYEKRIQAAYPIHPEIFDRLYTDWSTLVKFQRTRGVLRLMASVNRDGSARVIEVKTTGLGKHFPFYVSTNELRVSQQRPRDYHLYRVFNFASAPRMYPLTGALDQVCRLEPQSFVARVG